jgi:hypothetical protein
MMVKLRCGLRAVLLMTLIMGLPWFQVAWAGLDDGLVAYYPFNGNANDESGNGNHGTVIEATLVADKCGKKNQAYNFPESDDHIEIGDVEALDGIPQLTGIAWIKPYSVHASATLISKRHSCSKLYAGFLMQLSNSELTFFISDSSDTRLVVKTTSSPMSIDSWQLVAFVFDGSQADVADKMKIYYNGTKQPTSFSGGFNYPHIQTASTKSSLRIATAIHSDCAHEDFNGKMDDIRLYNRALSESEIQQLYEESESDPSGEPCSGESDTGGESCNKSSAAISFSNLKPLYNVGEQIVIDLEENVAVNRFNRVDLWVVIEIPSGDLLFMTGLAITPFSLQPQPFRSSLDNTQATHRVLEFEVLPGLGGDYNFYAVHVEEGKNLMTDSFLILRSNVAKVKVVLSNK